MGVAFTCALLSACPSTSAPEGAYAPEQPDEAPASAPLPLPLFPLPDDLPAGLEAGAALGISAESMGRPSLGADAGARVVPEWMRPDRPIDADPVKERELSGLRLEGEWRWFDTSHPPRAPEVSSSGLEAARKLSALKWTIDLAEIGRMRVRFASKAFPLPHGTELRARADRYGHFLVWPEGSRYRALPPGAVRTILGERRADVVPLARPQMDATSAGARRFGMPTRRLTLTTRTGRLLFDQAKVPEAGEGGALLCRLFAELVAVDPSAAPCSPGELPLRAQIDWPAGGSVAFEVTAMQIRPDIPSALLVTPPPSAAHTSAELPKSAASSHLQPSELAAFRTRPVEKGAMQAPGAPSEGLLLFNATDLLRYALVDGIPIAWVMPWQELHVQGLLPGRYVVEWRSFFGDAVEPPKTMDLPARAVAGLAPDGGAGAVAR